MPTKILTISLLLILTCASHAEPRLWKNKDASRSFRGEFVSRDAKQVVITMVPSGRQVTIAPENLHASDLQWLKENHPLDHEKPALTGPVAAQGACFDTVKYGDNQSTGIKKLKLSKLAHSNLDETYFARTGLNGVFKTTKGNDFFGMPASLYMDWDDQGGLRSLSFHGPGVPAADINTKLVPQWTAMIAAISKLHGQPKSSTNKLDIGGLNDLGITFTHAWNLESGSLLLGGGRMQDEYMIIGRLTSEKF